MGCGASAPADERLDGAGMLPSQGKNPSALAQKVTITSKPTKAVAPHKRQSTITNLSSNSTNSTSNNDLQTTGEKKRGKKEHGIVPVTTTAPSSPPQPHPAASVAVPPSPRSDRSRDITPRSPRTPRSPQQPPPTQTASTPTHLRSLQEKSPPAVSSEQWSSASRISVIDANSDIHSGGGVGGSGALERPRGGSHALPPLKMKGRPGSAALPTAAVPDELTATEPIGKRKKSKRNKDDQQPTSPSTQLSATDEMRTPKPRTQRSASSADLALPQTPQSRALARQSVVLAPLPSRSKTTQPHRASVLVPPTAAATSPTLTPATHTAKTPSISTSASPPATASSSSSSSPQFLTSEHQKQVDAHPSLWSSPTLLSAYPEVVFNHYAVMSHAPPTHTELMFISKKGVSRLGRDSVDEWMRVWRNRLNTTTTESGGDSGGKGSSKAEKGQKRAKGKLDTDGLFVLSRLLQMNWKSKKDVFRDDLDQWVVRRIRQELQADSEGRVSKANFINGWKSCHKGIFNTGSDEQGKPTDENPMACVVM